MALNSLFCADVPLRNYLYSVLTHSLTWHLGENWNFMHS